MSELAEEAFRRAFPGEKLSYVTSVKFSKKFRPYNANVKKNGSQMSFNLSSAWKSVSTEITIGLLQELLAKILRKKLSATTNTQLYNSFVKNLHLSAKRTETDERLLQAFDKLNEKYFGSELDTPNLTWGISSTRRLATYDYHTDTISVSTVFLKADDDVVAYLLYHEMLHKKLKFSSTGSRSVHHSRQFREMEKRFENHAEMEKQVERHLKNQRGQPGSIL